MLYDMAAAEKLNMKNKLSSLSEIIPMGETCDLQNLNMDNVDFHLILVVDNSADPLSFLSFLNARERLQRFCFSGSQKGLFRMRLLRSYSKFQRLM